MARYSIDFSTNAAKIIRDIEGLNKEIAEVARTGKSVKIDLDTSALNQSINATFKRLDKEIAKYQRQLRKLQIGSPEFMGRARLIGERQGVRERGRMMAESVGLRAQASAFEPGSAIALQKLVQSLQIEAQQIRPDTQEWVKLQQRIASVNLDLQKAGKLAQNIEMQESLNAFSPGSLNALEAKLTILRNRAREISPDTKEWKELNKELVRVEQNIERQTRRPMTRGQRLGAAGGAFLYGGGMGGGVGSALGGIAGGLMGGVPGAFTGAALGQMADNLGAMAGNATRAAAGIAQLQRGLALASIDAQDFAAAQKAIQESSDTLVVPLDKVYRQFTQLRVNTKQYGLSVKDTQEILEGTVLAVSSVGGSLEDVDGAMRAVVQIFSKGSVQAEELRGQLGERFPGAVVKFAQANKMSFDELQSALERGEVGIAEFVEFARKNYDDYAKFSERLATGPEFAGRRLEKAMNDMQIAIGSALGPAGAEFQDFFTETIRGFTQWVNKNKDFIGQYLQDWAKLVTDFGRIVGGLVEISVKVSSAIIKAFRGAIFEIRRLLGMVGVAEIKAQLDKVNAQIAAGQTGGRRRGAATSALETRRAQLQAQFQAAGGQAALDAATAPAGGDFVFGGPGAGMSMDRTGKAAKDKKAAGDKLREYTSNLVRSLQAELAARLSAIEADESIFKREKELQAARVRLDYEGRILQEQARLAQQDAMQYTPETRALFLQERKNEFTQEAAKIESDYAKVISGPLAGAVEDYTDKLQDEIDALELVTQGVDKLTAVQEAHKTIRRSLLEVTDEDLAKVPQLRDRIEALKESFLALGTEIDNARSKAFTGGLLRELADVRARLTAPLGQERLVELQQQFRRAGQPESGAAVIFELEQQNERLGRLREGAQALSAEINSGLGNALTSIVTDFQNLQQHGMTFLQTLANGFKQLANTIIQEMTRAMISRAVTSLFGLIGGGTSGSSIVQGLDVPVSQMPTGMAFANGGLVTGPTLGLVGEGRFNEAVVPLPNGKSIPVDLGGAAGNSIATNIVVNVNNGQASSSVRGNQGNDLAKNLEGAVKEVIMRETRPGGIIYSSQR